MDVVVVNNIFVQNKMISNYFKETAKDLYSTNISEININDIDASIQFINKQILLDTRGLVKNIISKGVRVLI
jgi:serine protease inhibitor